MTSTLLEPSSIEKIMEIDSHMGCTMSGLTADARTLIDHARVETQVCFPFFDMGIIFSFLFCFMYAKIVIIRITASIMMSR